MRVCVCVLGCACVSCDASLWQLHDGQDREGLRPSHQDRAPPTLTLSPFRSPKPLQGEAEVHVQGGAVGGYALVAAVEDAGFEAKLVDRGGGQEVVVLKVGALWVRA